MITPRKSTARIDIERYDAETSRTRRDMVAVEEPMEIRLSVPGQGEHTVAVTMRTPGNDFELAAGFLFSEGLIASRADVADLRYCDVDPQEYNVVTVQLRPGVPFDPESLTRNFYTTSSCGVCGKASLEAVEIKGCAPLPDGELLLDPSAIRAMPGGLRERQTVFERTGGLHAASLFDGAGKPGSLREDVGRHNAVDKVIGEAFLEGRLPLADQALAVSGRASFEILQKVLSAGIPAVVAVGAPSSLAVDLARQFNITLIGFTKPEGFNVYTGARRVG
ncbi:MAG: formate dehydrogenase accessory sulfurtransferase FdhD [Gemmatimonadota bacterium]|nr:formate dehydrogenase accessory sulfurtransferase FdhD [Gemmatimonadota bacterium]